MNKIKILTSASGMCASAACVLVTLTAALTALPASSQVQGNPLDSLPQAAPPPSAPMEINIEPQAPDPALQNLLNSHLVPSRFQISGVKALPFELVAAQFSPLANRDTTVAQLLAAAEKVTQLYRERGYPLSFAFIPAQNFDKNIVVVTVVEGYVKTVKVDGNAGNGAARLAKIAEQLQQDKPLRQSTFERVAGILNLQPGVRIVVNVAPPASTDGGTEMVLTVTRQPVSVGVAVDYRQPGLRGLITGSANGLTPFGEQVTLSTLQPGGNLNEEFYALNYLQPLGTDGLLAKLSWSDYRAEPSSRFLESLQFEPVYRSEAVRIGASLSYPVILSNTQNLTVTGGMYASENKETFQRSVPTTPMTVALRSQIRALSAEMSWATVTAMTQAGGNLQQTRQVGVGLFKGVDRFGAARENSNVDLDFTRLTLHLAQANQVSAEYGVAFALGGQYSNNILATSEKIGFGGRLFGLAYPAGEVAGDKGWGASAEINRRFVLSQTYLKSVQPYLLVDHAKAYSNSAALPHNTLASVALGARLSDGRFYTLDLSLAKPVGDLPFNSTSRSLRFNLMYSYQLH